MANKYLEKVALTRLVKELAKKPPGQKMLDFLVSKGALRSERTYEKGMRLGNENLMHKTDTVITRASGPMDEFMTAAGGGMSHIAVDPNTFQKPGVRNVVLFDPTMAKKALGGKSDITAGLRHELYEAQESNFIRKNNPELVNKTVDNNKAVNYDRVRSLFGNNGVRQVKGRMTPVVLREMTNIFSEGSQVGRHANLAVLARESNLIRSNPFLSKVRDMRSGTGEDRLISRITGKRFGADKMTGRDFAKARNAPPNFHIETPVHTGAFHRDRGYDV